jgi:hypothetical protein
MLVVAGAGPVVRALPRRLGTELRGDVEMLWPEVQIGGIESVPGPRPHLGHHQGAESEPLAEGAGRCGIDPERLLVEGRGVDEILEQLSRLPQGGERGAPLLPAPLVNDLGAIDPDLAIVGEVRRAKAAAGVAQRDFVAVARLRAGAITSSATRCSPSRVSTNPGGAGCSRFHDPSQRAEHHCASWLSPRASSSQVISPPETGETSSRPSATSPRAVGSSELPGNAGGEGSSTRTS